MKNKIREKILAFTVIKEHLKKFKYLSVQLPAVVFENTLACLSGAQMGSNHEKNWRSKIL